MWWIIGIIVLAVIIEILKAILGIIGAIVGHVIDHKWIYLGIIVAFIIIVDNPEYTIAIIGGIVVIKVMMKMAEKLSPAMEAHHRNKLEMEKEKQRTAMITSEEKRRQRIHENELELKKELERNCKYLGEMNVKGWCTQLPNYADKEYLSSFDEITRNFALQIEDQYIKKQAEKWMKDFEEYIVQRPAGSPIHKMLDEVDCDALRMTHITPRHKILEHYLEQGTQKISEDVLPKFKRTEAGDYVFYQPTSYLQHLYESKNQGIQTKQKKSEIIIDDEDDWDDIE